jgi:membrane associated rhomboid family serine protease
MEAAMPSFLRVNFDKILLFLLVIAAGLTSMLLVLWKQSPESIAWAQNLTGSLVGAMLAILTGRAMQRGSDTQGATNGTTNGKTTGTAPKPPAPPPAK